MFLSFIVQRCYQLLSNCHNQAWHLIWIFFFFFYYSLRCSLADRKMRVKTVGMKISFFQGFWRSCSQWDMNFKNKWHFVRKINSPSIKLSQAQETITWHCSHACVKNCWPRQMPRLNSALVEDSISEPSTTQQPSLRACSSWRSAPRDILPVLSSYLCFNAETFLCHSAKTHMMQSLRETSSGAENTAKEESRGTPPSAGNAIIPSLSSVALTEMADSFFSAVCLEESQNTV